MVGGRRTRCTQETRVDAAMSLRVGPFEGDPAEWDGFVRGSAGWTQLRDPCAHRTICDQQAQLALFSSCAPVPLLYIYALVRMSMHFVTEPR